MPRRTLSMWALLSLAAGGAVFAHDTWLLPAEFQVSAPASVSLQLTSGMAFPAPETAIQPDRIQRATVRLGGKTADLTDRHAGTSSLRLTAPPQGTGVAAIGVDLKPKTIELQPEEVREYLEEIGSPAAVLAAWSAMPAPKRWRETYSKHAKTFVRIGDPKTDDSWKDALGMALEILPEKDPTMLRAGGVFPIRVLQQGRPLSGFVVGLVYAGEMTATLRTTDRGGRVTFPLDRAGHWLVRGTDLRRSSRPDAQWESDFTTLTLEVH